MKRIICIILAIAICISICPAAFAYEASPKNVDKIWGQYRNDEVFGLEYYSGGNHYVMSYVDNEDGSSEFFGYVNGVLYERTKVYPKSTSYEKETFLTLSKSSEKRANIEIIPFNNVANENSRATVNKSTRRLGTMSYNNVIMGSVMTIECFVDEWILEDRRVALQGTIGTVQDLTSMLVGVLGISAGIVPTIIDDLVVAGVITYVGQLLKAATTKYVTAREFIQDIYGNSTTDAGLPTGYLPEGNMLYIYCPNSSFAGRYQYSGYHTHMWGTASLGCAMFYRVYGVDYTPTSWTSY
ncbi:MAG: hypothetical protein IKK17_05860 [Oscillospiraceae bacterium]|nr:hypothetical protein [Oscillospiraceae bacterium]